MATETEIVVSPHFKLTLPGGTEVYATQQECQQLYFMLANPQWVQHVPAGALLLKDAIHLPELPGRLTSEQLVRKAAAGRKR